MKKLVSWILVLLMILGITEAFAESVSSEHVYVRGEIREAIDMTEEQLSEVMNEAYQNGLNL